MSPAWKVLACTALALLGGEIVWITLPPVESAGLALVSPTNPPPASEPIPAMRIGQPKAFQGTGAFAGTGPTEALAAASAIPNRKRRLSEVSRLLRAWSAQSPPSAFEWASSQAGALRGPSILAVLIGAGGKPQSEFRLGQMLKEQDPQEAENEGLTVIQALANEKHFEAAIQFANAVSSDASPSWIVSVFRAWGTSDPRAALQALGAMDPAWHEEIFHALTESWSTSQPVDLADYAMALPSGKERRDALATLADRWSLQNPGGMANWLAGVPHSPDLDPVVAAMATRSDGANRPTALAVEWTETILDPELRFTTMEHLMREWMQTDLVAARTYVQFASWLTPQQRNALSQITDAPKPTVHDFEE